MRHFDVQLMGGMVLHGGNIAEMVTGEGKTLVATLAAYLNALDGQGVHVVTVNDYLARRDAEWMSPLFQRPGHDRRGDPVGDGLGRAAGDLRLRHHLRHQQRVRLRLPPRQHEADQGAAVAGRAQLRDHRRGRQHPDRRGPDAADHLRPGLRRRPQVRRGRPDRPAAQAGRPLRGQGEGADLPPERRGHPRGREDRRARELLHARQHGMAAPDRQLRSRPTTSTSATATTWSSPTARS